MLCRECSAVCALQCSTPHLILCKSRLQGSDFTLVSEFDLFDLPVTAQMTAPLILGIALVSELHNEWASE